MRLYINFKHLMRLHCSIIQDSKKTLRPKENYDSRFAWYLNCICGRSIKLVILHCNEFLLCNHIIILEALFKVGENWSFMLWVPKVDWTASRIRKIVQIFLVLFVLACKTLHVNRLPYLHVHVCKILLSKPFLTHTSLM